jgi:hypothetical protein
MKLVYVNENFKRFQKNMNFLSDTSDEQRINYLAQVQAIRTLRRRIKDYSRSRRKTKVS